MLFGSLRFGYGQTEKPKDSLWFKEGKVSVLLNQATFGEWLGGGTNNFNGIVNLDYKIQRTQEQWDWTTTLDASLGFTKTESSAFYKKTVDHLELNSVLARVGERPWGFSTSFNLKSQWIAGYAFSEGDSGQEISTQTTAIFSPLYARIGVGYTYKKSRSFSLQVEPLAGRLIHVAEQFTKDLAVGETYFGVGPNQQARWELGFSIAVDDDVVVTCPSIFSMSILSFIIPFLIQLYKLKKICFTSTVRSFFCSHSFVHKLAQA